MGGGGSDAAESGRREMRTAVGSALGGAVVASATARARSFWGACEHRGPAGQRGWGQAAARAQQDASGLPTFDELIVVVLERGALLRHDAYRSLPLQELSRGAGSQRPSAGKKRLGHEPTEKPYRQS